MEEQFKIEKKIPIPGRKQGKWTKVISLMQNGDSLVVDQLGYRGMSTALRRKKIKYVTRQLEDGNYRIWRVE